MLFIKIKNFFLCKSILNTLRNINRNYFIIKNCLLVILKIKRFRKFIIKILQELHKKLICYSFVNFIKLNKSYNS